MSEPDPEDWMERQGGLSTPAPLPSQAPYFYTYDGYE